ncbi:TonB-dependent receptor plug domain-containing protein [Sphingosinicella soli]|uniref:Outer membrane receptor protein involved in Fe transport n=1 Tax=Sphingosinicella soli TaxID=333708 RepID=A0A7W7F504_9SPHN|nr:TonB-dependent receptor [Sphingosinicella soli]MBB4630890.1 outer membrane receptor protein involved in Fe transport [Sphingosinicella soli]
MRSTQKTIHNAALGISFTALVAGLAFAAPAYAQSEATQQAAPEIDEIIVTGSRLARVGFDQPTPTTVLGTDEIRQGQRSNLQQVLNDSPQFRPTTTPQVSVGNTSSGNAPVDLRGLGANRTLTLVNGRRFVGQNNLNYVPLGLIKNVDIVTGGASAAYGSDAVAGVVNLILKDSIEGITIGGQTGISSRGDGRRYGADLTMGTSFADGRGQLLFSGEYVKDASIRDRNSRRNLGSAGIVRLNPTDPTDPRQVLLRDVNFGNQASEGLIKSGIFAGQIFNNDGTLRTYRAGTSLAADPSVAFPAQVVGGADAVGLYDALAVTTPLERISTFARASYDMDGIRLWADATYGRSRADYNFIPDIGASANLVMQANNPFLSPEIRGALADAGETSFTYGRFFDGPLMLRYDGTRQQIEGAIGLDADLGSNWLLRAHYSHGEIEWRQRVSNARIVSRFNNAINAVESGGQIVCGINADLDPSNDDAACRPLNLFGYNGPSAEALAYTHGTQRNNTTSKMDAASVEILGDLFSLWAGPVSVAFGAEARWEEQVSKSGALDLAGAYGPLNLYGTPVSGGFNVKEAFGEVALPLLDVDGTVKIDLNGAARYSDYSRSGGIWAWKAGATVGLFDTLLLRGTRSRDIRAPTIAELFTVRSIGVGPLVDQDTEGRAAANPGYNPTPQQVTTFAGGNPDLMPEISKTTTIGATFTPQFMPRFNLSVDYYDITISGAITTLNASSLTLACRLGNTAACDRITRDGTGTVIEVQSNSQNIARFETSGFDIEASYLADLSEVSSGLGSLRIRALATHVRKFVFDTGISRIDTAGDLGSSTANSIPKWRGVLSFTYETEYLGLDARIRYVGSGKFNHQLDGILVNNDISARTYLDLGAQFKVSDRFTLSASVNNVFDRAPPISPTGPVYHDAVGTYFTMGARAKF